MAIYQREREFNDILEEVEINTIPLRFVRSLRCVFQNGSTVLIDSEDLTDEDLNTKDVESLIKEQPFYESLEDLQIKLNRVAIERDTTDIVETIFTNALES